MIPLTLLPHDGHSRIKRDRLELLTALMNAPSFDPLYRTDLIAIPADHPVYAWQCIVEDCGRVKRNAAKFCHDHYGQLVAAHKSGANPAEFLQTATPLRAIEGTSYGCCRLCPARPARHRGTNLCRRHYQRWWKHEKTGSHASLDEWMAGESPLPAYGTCVVAVCPELAESPVGLCEQHRLRYRNDAHPGGASLPSRWVNRFELRGLPVPVIYDDEISFRRWCADTDPAYRIGTINMVGLRPLVKAEIQWGLFVHAQAQRHTNWEVTAIQRLANHCRRRSTTSLFQLQAEDYEGFNFGTGVNSNTRMICLEITTGLRCIYYSPSDTKDEGFIETDHFGRRFPDAHSTYDLTGIPQRWLRDLLWEYLADLLRSPACPRTRRPFDCTRRACVELGAFLAVDAPEASQRPDLLAEEHAQRFAADQRHRERHGFQSLALVRSDGQPSIVTDVTRRFVFNYSRKVLHWALLSGEADRIGLGKAFIGALPSAGPNLHRSRSPFSDEIARALSDGTNLSRLTQDHDPRDRGLRDMWEAIVYTGRRCGEVLKLRLDCVGQYSGLPMLWHDQTKVGNYNEGIRIPEYLYDRINQRRAKTLMRFERRHGRRPTRSEQSAMALFPTDVGNPHEDKSVSYTYFRMGFSAWVTGLDLGAAVPHQARHTLATNLLRAGASLAHIRRYLGQVSDRMAEHYVNVAHSDLEDVLNAVWVAGPGAPNPGQLLSGISEPLTREQALALAVDLSRRSTPADGGFCTFQPVVNGGACPWKLDCENCDKFVVSGADLLYWRRKQEQWRSIAERAPDDATADYLHQVFEPTARAITGLEKALAGLGLLDEALKLDMRRPQDYFHRIWSTNFRAADLAELDNSDGQTGTVGETSA